MSEELQAKVLDFLFSGEGAMNNSICREIMHFEDGALSAVGKETVMLLLFMP